ncbi:hypothetical protein [Chitinophaga nivalis]|uniref:DUF4234 domain-containing protein n=1 Tax=Chitinophaga nivalis TaxID=2991709 RepID=A0ABT3IK27_9BACT|nr:hypothetical protein [Chitinophaga nivalis]MCW3465992.1 hypothetical protein [Chitinophaga nivalis]MCW3484317.1 hypothetical protein [Chitinophaga nivalis]
MEAGKKNTTQVDASSASHTPVPDKTYSPVWVGLVMLGGGIVAAYFFIYRNYALMKAGAREITYSVKGMMLGPVAIIFGLYYLLIRPTALNPVSRRDRGWLYVFIVIMMATIAGLYFAEKSFAAEHGYFFN